MCSVLYMIVDVVLVLLLLTVLLLLYTLLCIRTQKYFFIFFAVLSFSCFFSFILFFLSSLYIPDERWSVCLHWLDVEKEKQIGKYLCVIYERVTESGHQEMFDCITLATFLFHIFIFPNNKHQRHRVLYII